MRVGLWAAAFGAAVAVSGCGGTAGSDGAPCTVAENTEGGYTLTCPGGQSVKLSNGADGAKGEDGTSCSATPSSAAGCITVSCPGASPADLCNGAAGEAGATGDTGPKGDTGAAGPKGDTGDAGPKGDAGAAGAPCTAVASTVNAGCITITCPESDPLEVCNGAQGEKGDKGDPGVAGDPGVGCTSAPSATAGCVTVTCGTGDPQEICSGDPGVQTLVKTSNEPAGLNCGYGGVKIEAGSDTNLNSFLDASEINAALTTYACNGQAGGSVASSGLIVTVTSVSTSNPVQVHFTMKDTAGHPVDYKGFYSQNQVFYPRFAISMVAKDAAGNVEPYHVLTTYNSTSKPTVFQPTFYNPAPATSSTTKTPAMGTLVEDVPGTGAYTYTFPATDVVQTKLDGTPNGVLYKAVSYDPTMMDHTYNVWIQASRQTDLADATNPKTFTTHDVEYNFIPSGNGTPIKREIVNNTGCAACHRGFKPEGLVSNEFHSGARNNPQMCNVCHNPARTTNPAADSAVFVHRIHYGEHIQASNEFHALAATYPQDIRNCNQCHGGAAQGDQINKKATILACGSCHDAVDFVAGAETDTLKYCTHPPATDPTTGRPVPCIHKGGPKTDGSCLNCHADGKVPFSSRPAHEPVVPPDPGGTFMGGTNANTNASWLAAAGYVPQGAHVISYVIDSVSTVAVAGQTYVNPQIKFKLQKNGTDVVFQTYAAGSVTELMPGFVGSTSVYFAWAIPQDGIAAPANFNQSASAYIKNVWNGTVLPTVATLSATPDANGFYTIVLTGTKIPPTATMLTGGVGYSYNMTSTLPITQIDLPAYPYDPAKKTGGLAVPGVNVWKVATGFTGRRPIADNAGCKACHAALGAAPTFHAGQRNDGPTCSFCHTSNRTSSGWSASADHFVHAIHSGRVRTQFFDWHAVEEGPGYGEVEFPARLNDCSACHVAGAYDFSTTASKNALPNHTPTTVAQGRYNTNPTSNPTGWFAISPYVDGSWKTNYGAGYSTSNVTYTYPDGLSGTQVLGGNTINCTADAPCICSAANPCTQTSTIGKQGSTTCTEAAPCTCVTKPATGTDTSCVVTLKTCTSEAPCEADGTTLVNSPVVSVCSSCHDAPAAIDHMEANGGSFYRPRSMVLGAGAPVEQCMLCHGPGKQFSIKSVHE